ncbi:MAG: rhodanese-like domain-containing protein [Clostridia bacterium]|nr:rhodanese-like domain-containing protein [Clostridia bacterium]
MGVFKKKVFVVLLVLAVSISLVGCGGGKTAEPPKEQSAPIQVPPTPAPAAPTGNVVEEAAMAYFANMPADIYKIPEKDFVAKVKAGEDMFILDIRQPDVYAQGHIKGAVNLPWGTAISDNLAKLPADKTIMVYCYTGQTAGQTVALLNIAGFDAKSVNLGWNLGISKVDGVDAVTETTANEIGAQKTLAIKPEIQAAITEYYKGLADVQGTMFATYKISEDDAKKLLDAKDNSVMFLSVRSAADYAKGHIEGAINIPFAVGMEKQFASLPKDKTIIVYCYTGQTAGQVVAVLRLLGYDAVSLNSGMGTEATKPAGWLNKGYPVVQ